MRIIITMLTLQRYLELRRFYLNINFDVMTSLEFNTFKLKNIKGWNKCNIYITPDMLRVVIKYSKKYHLTLTAKTCLELLLLNN